MKIGSVPYLNAKPLCHGLKNLALAVPSQLALDLRAGKLDAALVPVMECLENSAYDLVEGIGIACRGEVHSVILIHEKPLEEIKTIALDASSKTSTQLIQLLMKKLSTQKIDYLPQGTKADAQLLIGDPAIAYRKKCKENKEREKKKTISILDLGEAWRRLTSLPFVFAVWALRPHLKNKERADFLRAIAQEGLAARSFIATDEAELHYLTKHIRYEIGNEEKAALALFAKELAAAGAIDEIPSLNWI